MKQSIFEIRSNVALTDSVYKMVLAGDTSDITRPGQFVNIKLDGLYLRRPISICDAEEGKLTLIYKVVGKGTEQMRDMTEGTLDILSSLGNGYDTSISGEKPLLIGGGVGVPPLYMLAKELRKNMTPWERKLWYEFLRSYPVRFQRQKAIGNDIVDFYCAKVGVVIELDGGGHYTPEQAEKDNLRTKVLESMKLTVIRICNLDIDRNFRGVCEYIDLTVKNLSLSQLR